MTGQPLDRRIIVVILVLWVLFVLWVGDVFAGGEL